jgi:uncharacterized protein (DUF924 family)
MFVYLPFMHSEDLSHQQQSVTLFQQLARERAYLGAVSYAVRHQEIIERFGRFPHRNAMGALADSYGSLRAFYGKNFWQLAAGLPSWGA